ELELAGLTTARSSAIKPPRIAQSPVAFECRLLTSLSFGANQAVVFGQVASAYVADDVVLDAATGVVDTIKLDLFGAMHAARWYSTTSDRFAMDRPTWAQWVKDGKAAPEVR